MLNFNIFKRAQPKPTTHVAVSNIDEITYFDPRLPDLNKYDTIYNQGGIVSQAIDTYSLFALSAGYNITGPTRSVKDVKSWLKDIDINTVISQLIINTLVFGDGYHELVYRRNGKLAYPIYRDSRCFKIIKDKYGIVSGYKYTVNDKSINLRTDQVMHLQLFPGETYGRSLIERTFDDILRDTKTAESSAMMILRHGYGRFHIQYGVSGEAVNKESMKAVADEFKTLKPDNEICTVRDIDINNLDGGGLDNLDTYNSIFTSRLLAALGVPQECLGLADKVTVFADDSSVEMQSFLLKIRTLQVQIARVVNQAIELYTGTNQVTFKFNDLNPSDEKAKIAWILPALEAGLIDLEDAKQRLGV